MALLVLPQYDRLGHVAVACQDLEEQVSVASVVRQVADLVDIERLWLRIAAQGSRVLAPSMEVHCAAAAVEPAALPRAPSPSA
jgi:hypothetical protein